MTTTGGVREMDMFFIVGEEEGEREEEWEGDSPAGAGRQCWQRRRRRWRRTAPFCLPPPHILHLTNKVKEWRICICYAAVGLDCLGHEGQHKEGEVASVVMEGQIEPLRPTMAFSKHQRRALREVMSSWGTECSLQSKPPVG
jgi:hypothetical protein